MSSSSSRQDWVPNGNGGCNFIGWYEPPVDGFVHSLLVDLRDTVWSLKREKMELKATLADAVLKLEQQKKELSSIPVAEVREEEFLEVMINANVLSCLSTIVNAMKQGSCAEHWADADPALIWIETLDVAAELVPACMLMVAVPVVPVVTLALALLCTSPNVLACKEDRMNIAVY
ncbi:hypothetical protein HU200_052648 [Digitaria exilis]|uniref:Uncharacterized protein n=1 Tax=Digitaria exilis TaxID=1010633 RepID=A0A835AIQ6_9POAL|nr:hypothetical protein HU200_052648 [Digitaria exilis]